MESVKLERNCWGAISNPPVAAREILVDAIIAGHLQEEYCDVDRKHRGSALNYAMYDIASGVILIQQRYTTCTKWGNNPQKDYYLLLRTCDGVVKVEAPHKMAIVRASKLGLPAGKVIEKICGTQDADKIFALLVAAPRLEGKGKEVAA